MIKFLVRYIYIFFGYFILIPVVGYAEYHRMTELPKRFFVFDNEEDGYHGNKAKKKYRNHKGFWEHYHDFDYNELSFLKRWWYSYRWCALRNPAWNLRYHSWLSIDNTKGDLHHVGNTVYHDFRQNPTAKKVWYDCVTTIDGKKYKSKFRLIRLWGAKALYLRWGWKIYPEYRKQNKAVPKYKKRSVNTVTVRLRDY